MPDPLSSRIAQLAADRESGASELTGRVSALLADALAAGVPLEPVARALVAAQPAMAPIWNLVGQALAARADPAPFHRYLHQLAHAPRAVARHFRSLVTDDDGPSRTLRFVTVSFSGTVLHAVTSLAADRSVAITCAEGLPAREGRRLAARLAAAGVAVTAVTDAAIASGLDGADAVLVGADAVTPDWVMNKTGTAMLSAFASHLGVPVYVLATRDKFLPASIGALLAGRDGHPDEVWADPPPGVTVRNPYFEKVPLTQVAAVVSDLGVLGTAVVADACASPHDDLLLALSRPL